MVTWRNPDVGRSSVEVELANNDDIVRARAGDIPPSAGLTAVRFTDNRIDPLEMVAGIELTYGQRSSVFNAIVEPARDSALIGAIVVEDLDLIVDCTRQSLVPRDPERIVSEIEEMIPASV